MTHIPSAFGATMTINVKLLLTFGCGWAGCAIWPTTAEWWGLGFISIALGLAALGALADAMKLMVQVYRRERALRIYLAQGKAPTGSDLASDTDLTRAGMR